MNHAHPFSPITTGAKFQAAMEYIAQKAVELERTVLGRQLALDTICFFAQSQEEYGFLEQAVRHHGPQSHLSHGPTLYADADLMVKQWHITILGVRKPDPTRPWVGYGDFVTPSYKQLLHEENGNPRVREITSGRGKSLLELRHPDFDVLAFVVDEQDHIT